MRPEYDFSRGKRGKHAGKQLHVTGDISPADEFDEVDMRLADFGIPVGIPPSSLRVFLDVWALDGYVQMLENELPRVIEEERKRIGQYAESNDDEDSDDAATAAYELDKGITTRLLTGSALIAGWATYESVVKRIAKQKSRKKRLKLGEIKGAFPQSARKYFKDVLNQDLHPEDTDCEYLDAIYDMRNALAHANGQLVDTTTDSRARLKQWADKFDGVEIVDGQLIISVDFLRTMFNFISALLYELAARMYYEHRSATDDGESD